jgi:hypothetical protein
MEILTMTALHLISEAVEAVDDEVEAVDDEVEAVDDEVEAVDDQVPLHEVQLHEGLQQDDQIYYNVLGHEVLLDLIILQNLTMHIYEHSVIILPQCQLSNKQTCETESVGRKWQK